MNHQISLNDFVIDKLVDQDYVLQFENITHFVNPLFTIFIPTYKRTNLLFDTIESVFNQKKIGYETFEIIICKNFSNNDDYASIIDFIKNRNINNINIKLYTNKSNIGMINNWNRAFQLSKGKFISILHDDDLLSNNFLFTSKKIIESKLRNIEWSGFGFNNFYLKKGHKPKKLIINLILRFFSIKFRKLSPNRLFFGYPFQGTLGIIFNFEMIKRYGFFNSELFPSSDYFFISYLALTSNFYILNKKTNFYRILDNESFNPSLINGWVKHSLLLREYMLKNNLIFPILRFFNSMIFDAQKMGFSKSWENKVIKRNITVLTFNFIRNIIIFFNLL